MENKTIGALYGALFEICSQDNNFAKDSHFVAMQGKYYAKSSKKFMIIGRAPNGWKPLDTSSKERFAWEANEEFNDSNRWEKWIKCNGSSQYAIDQKTGKELDPRYCVSSKAFWSYSKEIYAALTTHTSDGLWQENIAWSNLYKNSPLSGYNPEYNSQKLQLQVCIDILAAELKILEPDYVLMMTGYDWFIPFSSIFNDINDTGERNVHRGVNKNDIFVEGTAKFGKSKVVITCRPEMRDKDEYIRGVLQTFKEMK